ncbi:hypothetical protein MNEG_1773 [Monoraphidium neglectum]|uniref:Uncharacterized protein n=1 Tax=Monoraphidium neglectum TaxID=145388 RepID=A0A0D2N0Z9_9CHLO|nr:hypothetical protein MNEG_1773 [Monoraphidium neglectum]KIZ06182.1 hypothetical protein MNEG_1773 [Monoraphidium neglectum]|eukprot:XP_013905201.1 hypothetical protein MNEG_1773 [Monoraphidium neglectum]
MLAALPGPALKAVLAHAGPEAAAACRLTHRAAAAAIADATPAISATLLPSTTRGDVDAWLRGTRRLAHAPELVVLLHGTAPEVALDLLLARVIARGAPRRLVLRGAAARPGVAAAAAVPSACLARVAGAGGVEQLCLVDVAVAAPADGDPSALLAPLAFASAASSLRALELGAGWAGGAPLQSAAAALRVLVTLPRLEELTVALPAATLAAPPAALAGLIESSGHVGAQLLDAAEGALAALAELRGLRSLTVTGLPDVWAPKNRATVAAIQAAVETSSRSAGAAACFVPAVCDGLAARLAAVMPKLRRLNVSLACASLAMRWASGPDGSATKEGLALLDIDAVAQLAPPRRAPAGAAVAGVGVEALPARLERALVPYAHADALPALTSLQLSLAPADAPQLAAALERLPALRALRLAVMATSGAGGVPLAALLAAVARSAPALESVVVVPGLAVADVDAAALTPLCALRGLRSLKLVGNLRPVPSAAAWAPLAALTGLRRLAVHNVGAELTQLPGSCLPAGLTALDLKGVRLTGGAAGKGDVTAVPALTTVRLTGCEVLDLAASAAAGPAVSEVVVAGCALGRDGWAAAPRAWPALVSLRAACGGGADAAALLAAVGGGGFPRLEALAVQRLPELGDPQLAALLTPRALRRLSAGANGCALTPEGIGTAAMTAAPGLRALALQLPARHLPAHLQHLMAGAAPVAPAPAAAAAGAAAPWWVMPAASPAEASAAGEARAPGSRLAAALGAALPGAAVAVVLNQAPVAASPCGKC